MRKTFYAIIAIVMMVSLLHANIAFAAGEDKIYAEAEAYLEQGDLYHAATTFYSIAGFSDARARSFEIWHQITGYRTIAGRYNYFLAVNNNGTVYTAKVDNKDNGAFESINENYNFWTGIVSIAVGGSEGSEFVAGLRPDGTVTCDIFDCSDWKDIVSISAGARNTLFGIKADGTVLVKGEGEECEGISQWRDVISIASGCGDSKSYSTIGLKADGTLVATGSNKFGQLNVRGYKDIVYITYISNIICLKKDGTVEVFGGDYSYKQKSAYENKKNIKLICDTVVFYGGYIDSKGDLYTTEFDGTKIDYFGEHDSWGDVVTLWETEAGDPYYYFFIGLSKNGTLKYEIADAYSSYDQDQGKGMELTKKNLKGWKNIRLPDTYYVSAGKFFSDEAYVELSDGEQWAVDFLKLIDSDYGDLQGGSIDVPDRVKFSAKVNSQKYKADIIGWVENDNSKKSFDWKFDALPYEFDLYDHAVFQSVVEDVKSDRIQSFYRQLWRCGKAISTLTGIPNPPNGNIDVLLDSRDEPQQIGEWIYSMKANKSKGEIVIHAEYAGETADITRYDGDMTNREGIASIIESDCEVTPSTSSYNSYNSRVSSSSSNSNKAPVNPFDQSLQQAFDYIDGK